MVINGSGSPIGRISRMWPLGLIHRLTDVASLRLLAQSMDDIHSRTSRLGSLWVRVYPITPIERTKDPWKPIDGFLTDLN